MQVARVFSALGRAELGDMNIVSTPRFAYGVHGLVDISDKMHQEFQGLGSVVPRRIAVGKHLLEQVDPIDNAVVVILLSIRILCIRTKTIALLGKSAGIHWNVDKVPGVSLGAIVPDVIRPKRNRGQIIITQQFLYMQPRD